jgi:hypothetical protein
LCYEDRFADLADVGEIPLKDMQQCGAIKKLDSSLSSPILIQKMDGDLRFCIDYRKLNDVTRNDCFLLPRIDNTLDMLARDKWVSTWEMKSAYCQVDLHRGNKEKTAFSTGQLLWQFTVMPFVFCDASARFDKLMETVLIGLTYELHLMYLDHSEPDWPHVSRTLAELAENVPAV